LALVLAEEQVGIKADGFEVVLRDSGAELVAEVEAA
jgi:hypothetical protein